MNDYSYFYIFFYKFYFSYLNRKIEDIVGCQQPRSFRTCAKQFMQNFDEKGILAEISFGEESNLSFLDVHYLIKLLVGRKLIDLRISQGKVATWI